MTVGRSLDVLIEDDFSITVGDDDTAGGILYALDDTSDVGLQCGILKGAVALRVEGTVFKHQVLSIAEGLLTADVAVDKPEVLGVPSQIFSVKVRVVDGDVFHLPERILGDDMGIVYLHIAHILEDILAVAF